MIRNVCISGHLRELSHRHRLRHDGSHAPPHTCLHTHECICAYMYIYTYTYIHTYMYMYMYIMCIHLYAYIFIYTYSRPHIYKCTDCGKTGLMDCLIRQTHDFGKMVRLMYVCMYIHAYVRTYVCMYGFAMYHTPCTYPHTYIYAVNVILSFKIFVPHSVFYYRNSLFHYRILYFTTDPLFYYRIHNFTTELIILLHNPLLF